MFYIIPNTRDEYEIKQNKWINDYHNQYMKDLENLRSKEVKESKEEVPDWDLQKTAWNIVIYGTRSLFLCPYTKILYQDTRKEIGLFPAKSSEINICHELRSYCGGAMKTAFSRIYSDNHLVFKKL